MKRRRVLRALGSGLGSLLWLLSTSAHAGPPSPSPGDSPDARQEAVRLYNEGTVAAKAGRTRRALDLYTLAWRRHRLWQIAASLGRLEHSLKRYRDAAEHLDFAVHEAPLDKRDAVRAAAREMLEGAKAHVGTLSIVVDPPGAEVLVDGKVVGRAPLSGVVYVEPGPVEVAARLGGYEAVKESRVVKRGQTADISLRFRSGDGKRRTLGDRSPSGMRDSRINWTIVTSGYVATGIALGVAAGFGIRALSLTKSWDSALQSACASAPGACTYDAQRIVDYNARAPRRSAAALVSTIGFVAAGAVGIGTSVYLVTSATKKSGREASIQLDFGPGGASIAFNRVW
jgi:hypothetical protein